MNKLLRFVFMFLICIPTTLLAAEKLIFSVDLIRHGDRTPGEVLPTVNFEWKEGLEQLTAKGMQQEYEMGVKFRKRYVEQTHLLPEHYESGTIYVRSTDYERTLMSAQSLLMGLYPPGTGPNVRESTKPALPHAFQPIPIFSAPYEYDDVIYKSISQEEEDKLIERYVHSTKDWQQKNKELQYEFPRWSLLTGVNIKTLENLSDLGDTLYIYQINHAPMPPGLSNKDIETIITAGDWAYMAAQNPPQIAAVYSTQLMTKIGNYLESGSQESSKLKYVLLSAHDDTIASALSYMGAPLKITPPFASNLNFSLYLSGHNHYIVKVTYNDSPVFIPACNSNICELDQFMKLTKSKV